MKRVLFTCLHFFLLVAATVSAAPQFGYISYSTTNIGDDIQAIAAKRFLPENSTPIDREFISVFESNQNIHTIVNGWYMHTKDIYWQRDDVPPPEKSWPPAPSIDPLLISMHFTTEFIPTVTSDESVEYLKKHAPVGARDLRSLEVLQEKGVPSYFSGCLTLTLEKRNKNKRRRVIYVVDLDKECIRYIRSKTRSPVKVISHGVPLEIIHDNEARLKYANKLLNMYNDAKCVVTARLHASMPCLALETPVLLVGSLSDRFLGLKELVRHCTKEELLSGQAPFNFNRPPENPKAYLPIRENLIEIITNWLEPKE